MRRGATFLPDAVALMTRVCDEAWAEIQAKYFYPNQEDATEVRHLLASRILDAVADGELDPQRLKQIALEAIDG